MKAGRTERRNAARQTGMHEKEGKNDSKERVKRNERRQRNTKAGRKGRMKVKREETEKGRNSVRVYTWMLVLKN